MKIEPIHNDRYTLWELLEFLGFPDYEWDNLMCHVKNGNIQMQGRINGVDTWIDVLPGDDYDDEDFMTFTCTFEEAERFKTKYICNSNNQLFQKVGQTLEPNSSSRHIISDQERRAKSKSAIQLAVEAYLAMVPDGNKSGFYLFLKDKIKSLKEESLKDCQSYAFYFNKVTENGSREGVYLNHPKEGKKEGDPSWNHYSSNDISSIISKEKAKRKKCSSQNSH